MRVVSFLTILLLAVIQSGRSASTSSSLNKIDPALVKYYSREPTGRENIFVSFSGIQKVLGDLAKLHISDRGARTTQIYQALKSHAEKSHEDARRLLHSMGFADHQLKSFWINNKLYVKGADKATVEALAQLDSVTKVNQEAVGYLKRPIQEGSAARLNVTQRKQAYEWNVEKMGVHLVWQELGVTGQGVVVGIIDTGVRGTHEAIRDQYRNDGKSWRDPYDEYYVPTDIYNHGTHTCGSVLGKFGIGMAPDAQWIACKGYRDDGSASTSMFYECGQFMVCPTDEFGENEDCTKTPHVTSNSWGVWPGTDFFEDIFDVWNTVGIISLFSNGNEGPGCGDLLAPADSTKTLGIGATDINDGLASFSSRGPSRYGVHKPDISAPGVGIRSCDCNGDDLYVVFSGTSMSCPNAAGVATLMVSKDLSLSVDRAKDILESTAVQQTEFLNEVCDDIPDNVFPNNHYGHGRVDGYAAVQAV